MKESIQFVQQPTPSTCVHSCIAMVTGVDVQKVIFDANKMFGRKTDKSGLNLREEHYLLTSYGIIFNQLVYADLLWGNLYIATVPSLNKPAVNHRIIIDMRQVDNDYLQDVHDPNKETGRAYYEWRDLKCYGELTHVWNKQPAPTKED